MLNQNLRVVIRQEDENLHTVFFTDRGIALQVDDFGALWAEQYLVQKKTLSQIVNEIATGIEDAPPLEQILEDGRTFLEHAESVLLGKTPAPSTSFLHPINAEMYIGHGCNLSCVACFQRPHTGFVATEEVLRRVDILARSGIFFLKILGGETFLHPGIWQILDHATVCGMNITAITNGTLITERLAERIAKYSNLNMVVSIDGVEMHDVVRGKKGLFEESFGAVRRLRTLGVPVGITCTVSKLNMHEFFDLVQLGNAVGAVVGLNLVKPYNEGTLVPTPREYFTMILEAYRLKKNGVLVDLMNAPIESLLNGVVEEAELANECEAGASFLSIMVNGNITPCSSYYYAGGHEGVKLATIDDLETAWTKDKSFVNFRKIYQPKGCVVRESFYNGQDPYNHAAFREFCAENRIPLPLVGEK